MIPYFKASSNGEESETHETPSFRGEPD